MRIAHMILSVLMFLLALSIIGVGEHMWGSSGNQRDGIFNVLDYGAVGNGSNNDTSAVQAAMDACTAVASGRKGIVLFPPGQYRIESTLTMTACSLVGISTPSNGVIVRWDGAAGGTLLTMGSGMFTNRIENIQFNGATSIPGTMIQTTAIGPDTFTLLQNVHFRNFDEYGLNVDAGWYNLHIRDMRCDIYDGWCIRLAPTATQQNNLVSIDNFQAHPGSNTAAEGFMLYDNTLDNDDPSPVMLSNGILELGPGALTGDKAFISVVRNPSGGNVGGVSFHLQNVDMQDGASTSGDVFIYRDDDDVDSEDVVFINVSHENVDALVGPSAKWDIEPPLTAKIPYLHIQQETGAVWAKMGGTYYSEATTGVAFQSSLDADAANRFQRDAGGVMSWGNGTDAVDTNLYRSAADVLHTDDTVETGAGVLLPYGAVGTPALRWTSDPTTGIWGAANNINFSTGGIIRGRIAGNAMRMVGSAEGDLAFAGANDTNTGLFFPGSNEIGIATAADEKFRITATGKFTPVGTGAFIHNIGTEAPQNCTAGEIYIDTSSGGTYCNPTNANSLCLCTATDTWTVLENN